VRTLARPSTGYGSFRKGAEEIPPVIPAGASVKNVEVRLGSITVGSALDGGECPIYDRPSDLFADRRGSG